ncbi:hypothetical protein D3C78_1223760 [compost metagenome]
MGANTGNGRDVDDRASTILGHRWNRVAAHQHGAGQVDVQHSRPGSLVGCVQRDRRCHADIVDEDIEAAVAADRFLHEAGAVVTLRDITSDDECLAAHRLNVLAGVFCTIGVQIDEANARALACENDGNGPADADTISFAASACDDGDLAGERCIVVFRLRHGSALQL